MSPAVTTFLGFIALCLSAVPSQGLSLAPSTRLCPGVCKMLCPNGFVLDRNGCEICECKEGPEPICPLVRCPLDMRCPFGFDDDINGCPTCMCKRYPIDCLRPICKNKCPNGYQINQFGCQTCNCKPAPICEPLVCDLRCRIGRERDSNGCEICKCRLPDPVDCPLRACPPPFGHCRNGYIFDSRGCNTCKCKPDICPLMMCAWCPNGFVYDHRGCQTCECKRDPDCPPFFCQLYCNSPSPWMSRRVNQCKCHCRFDQQHF